jgi:hypothetical protein
MKCVANTCRRGYFGELKVIIKIEPQPRFIVATLK